MADTITGAAGEDKAAVGSRDRRRTVETGLAHTREEIAVPASGAGPQIGQDPGWRIPVVLVVLDRVVLQVQAEAREQLVHVVAVLLLLGLAQHYQPTAGGHERLNRVELLVTQPGRAGPGGSLPCGIRGVGDHQHVAPAQRLLRERAVDVGRHDELPRGEGSGSSRVGRIAGMRRLHLAGELGTDRPCLAVRLVEHDTRERP